MQDPRTPSSLGGGHGVGGGGSSGGGGGGGGDARVTMPFEGHGRRNMDQSDLVGIKDNIALSPPRDDCASTMTAAAAAAKTTATQGQQVRLAIKCPSLGDSRMAESTIMSASINDTFAQLKQQIQGSWPGRPKADGMRFFKSGQLLTDAASIGSIVGDIECDDAVPIHLVIRPGAWTKQIERAKLTDGDKAMPESLLSDARSMSAKSGLSHTSSFTRPSTSVLLPAVGRDEATQAQGVASSTALRDRHFARFIEKLDPSQYATIRSLLSYLHSLYIDQYEDLWMQSYASLVKTRSSPAKAASLHALAQEMECSTQDARTAVESVEHDVLLWEPLEDKVTSRDDQSSFKYKQIQLGGLPYLLRVERTKDEEKLAALLERVERLRNLLHQIEKLINYQSLLERTMANSALLDRSLVNPASSGGPSYGIPAIALNGAMPVANRDNIVNTTSFRRFALLQRGDVASILMASSFLTFKMGILVYFITRGASRTKMALIAGAAAVYVLFEMFKMMERKVLHRRRALERVLGQGQRTRATRSAAVAEQMPVQQQAQARQASPTSQQRQQEEADAHDIPPPLAPTRHRTTSPFLLDFWIERLAYLNLAEEDIEIGMVPLDGRTSRERHEPQNGLVRLINDYIILPVVLFAATLVPEIEQRRRRAIERREDMIRTTARRVEEQEHRRARMAEKTSAGSSTVEKKESTDEPDASLASSPSTAVGLRTQAFLQSSYGQRILRRRSEGRQIDIAQELEAAAAAENDDRGDGGNGLEQADLGFI